MHKNDKEHYKILEKMHMIWYTTGKHKEPDKVFIWQVRKNRVLGSELRFNKIYERKE